MNTNSTSETRQIPMPAQSPIDLDEMRERLCLDEVFIQSVLLSFVDDLDRQLSGIRTAVKSGNLSAVAAAAHSLKGAAATISAGPLMDGCRVLEKFALTGEAELVKELASRVLIDAEALRAALEVKPAHYESIDTN